MTIDPWGDEYNIPNIELIREKLPWLRENLSPSVFHYQTIADLCDEIERLRERNTYIRHCNDVQVDKLRAQRAEVERLFGKALDLSTEVKRLELEKDELYQMWMAASNRAEVWKICATKFAECDNEANTIYEWLKTRG